ncbi:hypothetical protein BGZ96_008850 [Linnemannia gamsii]|uniref:Uncharacterized protein n=1 Tax=Linnemannia gamsii TaxID=64522 RepID=A0ABQ7KDM5_9FUNG|nr:hypothetical protein BGZ96_008850 [Linnemannia gamsii]
MKPTFFLAVAALCATAAAAVTQPIAMANPVVADSDTSSPSTLLEKRILEQCKNKTGMHFVMSTILAVMLFAATTTQAAPAPGAPRPPPVAGRPFFTPKECIAAGNFPFSGHCLIAAGYLKAPPKAPAPKPIPKPVYPRCLPLDASCPPNTSLCCPGMTCRKIYGSPRVICAKA